MVRKSEAASCDVLPKDMLSVEQGQQRILQNLGAIRHTCWVSLQNALGRILAADIDAGFDVPPHRNASMDGYAFAHHDTVQTEPLRVIGASFAGKPFLQAVQRGECVRIMTGAMVPDGCDTVEMQEHCQCDGDWLTLNTPPHPGSYIRYPGEDLKTGERVLAAGRKLNAADLGLLASLGISEVEVLRKLRVAFCSTGDELCAIGEPLGIGDIYDSNRYTLRGMLQPLNVELLDLGVVRDTPQAVEQVFSAAAEQADVLISSGGVSVGDADYVTTTLRKLGEVSFWKMAMKPGKPLAHGRLGDCLFFGLPGNPVSVMATFLLFVRPALLKLSGETVPVLPEYNAITTQPLKKAPGRKEYQRGICTQDAQGHWQVASTGIQESHLLRSMSQANCFIVLEAESGDHPAGSEVKIIPFAGFMV
ncbi:MAG: molybdopterin molybdenumtransferase MoeA [Thiothrix nivea]|nr:MAG: molybdopterin molybdenumtransferase MoeA [Thiothrix nivea]